MANVCVIGAGINGLSIATHLQRSLCGAKITIITDEVTPNLTSDAAAGFWKPYLLPDPRKHLIAKWGLETFRLLESLYSGGDETVTMVSGYVFNDVSENTSEWETIVYNFRHLTSEEIASLGYSQYKFGYFFTTYCLDVSAYLKTLAQRFLNEGGKIIQKKLESLDDLPEDYDIIVNCSALGSKVLFDDRSIYPIRGQVVRVKSSTIKHFFMFGTDYYTIVNGDRVILGGTHENDDWDRAVRSDVAKRIWQGCQNLIPQLKNAKLEGHAVGLRPARPTIRLELNTFKVHGKEVPVVHNYGHGGSGITLFYGCCLEVASLVEDALRKK
ncbi:D-amino-acid oxidase 2 [Toxocara canis]|uniref:D-amino-acid oxidase 2 n=1 Tax=Toxocara canis TaxID=6265 RepID=A0A0B2V401_TOXCA|nr:D-amino-acid oxidase 2 [Toxocara canis]